MTLATALQVATLDWTRTAGLQLSGLVLAGGVVATVAATLYRRSTLRPLPGGVAPFVAVATVGCWMLAEASIAGALVEQTSLDHHASAAYVVAAAAIGAGTGVAGGRLGDRIACDVYDVDRLAASGQQAERLRAARLQVPVDLPATVRDAEGYRPVPADRRRALAESRFLVPAGLSDGEIADRVEGRVRNDFGVDHASVTLGPAADVASIAVGDERRGLGPELPPGTVAVGVRADPGSDVAPGDAAELWSTESGTSRLLARGRLHARSGDRTTVVVPEDAATDVDAGRPYRLVMPPDAPSDSNRLLAILRSVPQTTVAFEARRGGPLEGEFVGWLPGTVVALQRGDDVVPFPADGETLDAGDVAYCFDHPEAFRDHEASTQSGADAASSDATEEAGVAEADD